MNELKPNRKDSVLISIYSTSVNIALLTLAVVAALEAFMIGFSIAFAPLFAEYLWKYRSFYIALLVAALVGIAVILYVRKDKEHRFRILKIANPIFAAFLLGWALLVTYSDALNSGVVSPIVFMTFSLMVTISFFVLPVVFAVMTIAADAAMLAMTICLTSIDFSIINLLVFFIFQFVLGISFIRIRIMLAERLAEEKERAEFDIMTGCMNRRVFAKDIERIKNDPAWGKLIYIVIDVNALKDVNDRFGHDEGDRLIIETARNLKAVFENDGHIYRTGGDEFAVLINTTNEEADAKLARFDEIMKERSSEFDYEVSASYGYASRMDDQDISIGELAKTADRNMYDAKNRYYMEKGIERRKAWTALGLE